MKNNELDLVSQLLKNDKKEVLAESKKVEGPKDAKSENKPKAHYPGDCMNISMKDKQDAGLPQEAYIVVKQIGTPNQHACVYDPVHWIYGWGEDTMSAVRDCLYNIKEYRKSKPKELIDELISGWQERLKQYGHPLKPRNTIMEIPKASSKAARLSSTEEDIVKKPNKKKEGRGDSTADILEDLGL
jgi:hypothetical protein